MDLVAKANDGSQVQQFNEIGTGLEGVVVTPSRERVRLTVDSLQGLNAGAHFDKVLINTLPTLWHADHVVRLHTDFYEQIKMREYWETTRERTRELERTGKIWIMHVQEGDGWLSVCLDWRWMQVSCYNPLMGWEAHQRCKDMLEVSFRPRLRPIH